APDTERWAWQRTAAVVPAAPQPLWRISIPPSREAIRTEPEILNQPDCRLGSAHVRERLRVEAAHEQHMSRGGMASLRTGKLLSTPKLIRSALKSVGLYRRARANAARVQVEENILRFANLPEAFD